MNSSKYIPYPHGGRLVISLFFPEHELAQNKKYSKLVKILTSSLKMKFTLLPPCDFDTPYQYKNEAEEYLISTILFSDSYISQSDLIVAKQISMELENKFSINGRRKFNINPGYISDAGLFLSSHKPTGGREFIGFDTWLQTQWTYTPNGLLLLKPGFDEFLVDNRVFYFEEKIKEIADMRNMHNKSIHQAARSAAALTRCA